jgi:hypothetical protein
MKKEFKNLSLDICLYYINLISIFKRKIYSLKHNKGKVITKF